MGWSIYVFGVLVLTLLGYLGYVVVVAKAEVDDSPREDMFTCDKHGVIPLRDVLHLDVMVTEKPVQVCPFCLHDKMKAAKR